LKHEQEKVFLFPFGKKKPCFYLTAGKPVF